MELTLKSLKAKVMAGVVTALSGGFIWWGLPYGWEALQGWDDHEDQHTEIEEHMDDIDLLELDDIEDNKEHLVRIEDNMGHLLRDIHDVQMSQSRMEGMLDGLDRDRGFTFNRLDEAEETRAAFLRRDSLRSLLKITVEPLGINHGESH